MSALTLSTLIHHAVPVPWHPRCSCRTAPMLSGTPPGAGARGAYGQSIGCQADMMGEHAWEMNGKYLGTTKYT
jgi:hypothetical protein